MYKLLKVVLIALIFSTVLITGCKKNKAPDIPSTPAGPTSGSINTEYIFTSSAEDLDNDSVAIRLDWGDGDTSNWSSWKASDDSVSMVHSWSDTGTYFIKAQAKDKKDVTSDWSAGHQIVISRGWTKVFGGPRNEWGFSVLPTTDGGYIIVGSSRSYGAGFEDVYLIKTDGGGNELWYKTFGGSSPDYGYSVHPTSDDGYIITGITSSYGAGLSDVYLIKTDAYGNQQWFKTFGGTNNDEGYSVQLTADGGYIIAGYTNSYGTGGYDIYLIKTDDSGNQQWYKTFGSSSGDYGYSVQQTYDGGYIIIGYTYSNVGNDNDIYLIKTDSIGCQQWSKTFGGSDDDEGYSVQPTSDGGYIITGWTYSYGAGTDDVYLIKTDGNGNEQWYKTLGGIGGDEGYSVQPTSDGGFIITGWTYSYGAGSDDVYLIKTDASGNQQWYKTFGGSSGDYGYSVQQTSDGGYIIIGWTRSYGAGERDVYLIKTDANGNVE